LGIATIQTGTTIAITLVKISSSHNSKQEGIEFGALPKVTLMTNQNCLTTVCRYCRFYRPDGLRGGACEQLGVSVHSNWTACQLALPAFASNWNNAEELAAANRTADLPQIVHSEEQLATVGVVKRNSVLVGSNN
jgi:hypothetical protein